MFAFNVLIRTVICLLIGIAYANLGATCKSQESFNSSLNSSSNQSLIKHDPDWSRNVSEIIRSRGFGVEEYDVITRDGYILTIHRIVNQEIDPKDRAKMKPVILQHGLLSCSAEFVIDSPNVRPEIWPKPDKRAEFDDISDVNSNNTNSIEDTQFDSNGTQIDTQEHPNALAFYMANRGYDVFLTNTRGNQYSMRHLTISAKSPKFWSFTVDEMIKYDMPDMIKFILKLTGKPKLGYVGHSQGTFIMFGLLSEQPEFADIVEPFVALAPIAFVGHLKSPGKFLTYLAPMSQRINAPFTPHYMVKYFGPLICEKNSLEKRLCSDTIYIQSGFDYNELNTDRMDAYMGHMPSSTSIKNIGHFSQMVVSGRMAHFDFGKLGNLKRYGTPISPSYDLSRIKSKSMVLFIANNDWMSQPKDIEKLLNSLAVEPYAIFNMTEVIPKWNHIDYVHSKHVGTLLNPLVEQVFNDFENN